MGRTTVLAAVLVLLVGGVLAFLLTSGERGGTGHPGLQEPVLAAQTPGVLPAAPADDDQATPDDAEQRTSVASAAPVEAAPALDDGAFEATAVYGTVASEDGAPIADAEVLLFGRLGTDDEDGPLRETRTDEGGRFRFREHGRLERYVVIASAPGHATGVENTVTGHDVEVELEKVARVAGRVLLRASRTPVVGAEVVARTSYWDDGAWHDEVVSVTDAEGRYALGTLEPGEVEEVRVRRAGHLAVEVDFQIDEARTDGYDILLDETAPVVLELVDHEADAPLANFVFELAEDGTFETDEYGLSEVRLDPDRDPLRFGVRAEGWCSTWLSRPRENVTGALELPMVRGATVHGRVLDADGAPVVGARVQVSSTGSRWRTKPSVDGLPPDVTLRGPQEWRVHTDEAGRYEVTGLLPTEVERDLIASHPGFRATTTERLVLREPGERRELDLVLETGARLRGVVTVDGEPVSTALWWTTEDGENDWTRSNDRGEYRFDGVPAGRVELDARLDARSWNRRGPDRSQEVWIEGDEVVFDLALTSDRVAIQGHVVSRGGAPVEGVDVRASNRRGTFATSVETDAEGAFELLVPDEAGETYTLSARRDGLRTYKNEVPPGATGLELVLPDAGKVRLSVRDALRRELVENFRVSWRADAEDEWSGAGGRGNLAHGPDGTFVAEVERGRVDLLVTSSDASYRPLLLPGVLAEAEPKDEPVVALLEAGTTLVLRFDHANDEARSQFFRWLRRRPLLLTDEQVADGSASQPEVRASQRMMGSRGAVRLRGLLPGSYAFQDVPDGLEFVPDRVEVPATDELEVRVSVRTK